MKTMLDEWKYQKAKYDGAMILFKVGEFYESYDKDAIVLSDVCGIPVTRRKSNGVEYAMAGFPYIALDVNMPKLIRAGHRVAIVDTKDINFNNKNNKTMNNENMNQENENVVVTEKTIRELNADVRFVYMDGKLQRMQRDHVEYDLDKLEAKDYWRIGGGEPQLVSQDMEFYRSEENFKAGKPMGDGAFFICTVQDVFDRCHGFIKNGKAWVYEDGRAVEWDAAEHIHKVWFDGVRYKAVDVELPVLYKSAEGVYEWNNYICKDDKGNVEEREGKYVPLIPDADQMPIVEKLKAVLKECKEAGLKVMWDSEDYELGVINARRVEDWGYYNYVKVNEENGERSIPLMFHRDCYLECGSMCCDDVLVIKKK